MAPKKNPTWPAQHNNVLLILNLMFGDSRRAMANALGMTSTQIRRYVSDGHTVTGAPARRLTALMGVDPAWMVRPFSQAEIEGLSAKKKPDPRSIVFDAHALSRNLRWFIENRHDGNLQVFCEIVGLPRSTVLRYIDDQTLPPPDKLEKLINHVGLGNGWFVARDFSEDEKNTIMRHRAQLLGPSQTKATIKRRKAQIDPENGFGMVKQQSDRPQFVSVAAEPWAHTEGRTHAAE